LLREARKGEIADGIIAAVKAGIEMPADKMPRVENTRDKLQVNPAIADLLRVLLKARSEAEGVAQKLIATSADLDSIAAGDRDVHALKGWRKEVFGDEALLLCQGKVALATKGNDVITIKL
jgi:ribonuclease D